MDMNTGRVCLTGLLLCRSRGDVETVQRHLPAHIRLTRAEPGCVSFEVSQSDDPLIWNVEECFRDKQAFEFHQHRTRASTWWTATSEIPRQFEVFGIE